MKSRGWLAIAPVMALAVAFVMASCAKRVVQSQVQTQVQAQPVSMTEPKAQKTPEKPTGETGKAGKPEDYRQWAEAAAREAAARTFLKEHIHFAFGSYLLSDQARQILHDKAEYLRTNPEITVTVEGHCDDRGSNAYNAALGQRRAESVKMFLVDQGIGSNRLITVSYGEERPIAMGHDEDSWAKNRRAQCVINRSSDGRASFKN